MQQQVTCGTTEYLTIYYFVSCRQVSLALQSRERAKMAALHIAAPTTQASDVGQPASAVASVTGDVDATAASSQQHCSLVSALAATKRRRRLERKRRTNRMLIAMVLIFVVCWLPLNVIHVTYETIQRTAVEGAENNFYDDFAALEDSSSDVLEYGSVPTQRQQSGTYLAVFFVVHLIAMSSAVYNPFLYAWMNENFKGHFVRVVPCLFRSTYFYCTFTRRVDGDSTEGAPTGGCCCTISRKPPLAGRRQPGGSGCCGVHAGDETGMGEVSTGWSPSMLTTVRNDNGCAIAMVSTSMPTGRHVNHVQEDDEDDDDDDEEDDDDETQLGEDHLKATNRKLVDFQTQTCSASTSV